MNNQTRNFAALEAAEEIKTPRRIRVSYIFLLLLLVLGAGGLAPVPVHAQVTAETQSIVEPCAIPFEIIKSRITISAVVNGQHGQLYFENGFSGLMLNQEYFESGPKKESRMVFGKSTRVGNTNAQVAIHCTDHIFDQSIVGDLSHMVANDDDRVILGVIGSDIFAGGSVTFDLQNDDLLYSRSFAQSAEENENLLELSFEFDMPVVRATFQDREIKVGLASSLSNCFISKRLVKKATQTNHVVLLGQDYSLSIADLPVKGIVIRGHDLRPFNRPGEVSRLHGILGQEFFKLYQVTIDYQNSQVRVREYPEYRDIATVKK